MHLDHRNSETKHRDPAMFGIAAMGSSFGFIIDSLRVIFKLTPDDGQTWSEFLFEKFGALALLAVSLIVLATTIVCLYFLI